MSSLDLNAFFDEMTVFFRNQNIFTIAERDVTTITDEFNGNASDTVFTITRINVKNIRAVTVDGSPVAYGTDYLFNLGDGSTNATVTFTVAPGSGTDNVDIQYDYGEDKIFPDYPKNDLTLNDFPRIGWDIISQTGKPGEVGSGTDLTETVITVIVYEITKRNLRSRIKSLKDSILSNQLSFFYVTEIRYLGLGPAFPSPYEIGKNKVIQQNVDFIIPHEFEEA